MKRPLIQALQETEQESEPEDFDTPESEHMDTETLVENWGTTYSDHKRVGLGSFSPSQLSEKLDENWGTESRMSLCHSLKMMCRRL